ncbi:IS30 family transposase [Modestobacter lacusdianchii]
MLVAVTREKERLFWRAVVREGASTSAAAASARVTGSTARRWFRDRGGVAPLDLDELAGRYLSLSEREEIAVGLAAGLSLREIARRIGRAPSTVSREIALNGPARPGRPYRAVAAQQAAEARARRPKARKLEHPPLQARVQAELQKKWSPEEIAARLTRDFPDQPAMRASHETIYRALFVQGRGSLRRELTACLRTGRAVRKPQRRVDGRSDPDRRIPDKVMISERPAEAEDRAVPGHWEGDQILGKANKSAIGTLVERTTRFTILLHLPGPADAIAVRDAIIDQIGGLPEALRRSLTWDQGLEMRRHTEITVAADLPVYFCDPRSPWQRGSNENTNGLLRQYFPKGTDLSVHSPQHLAAVADELNGRPRKTLGWDTPAEAMAKLLSTAHDDGVASTP